MIPSTQQWRSEDAPPKATRQEAAADTGTSASNMQSTAPPAPKPLNLQSCQFCRKRKIKCDKLEGCCSQCMRAQTECIYPASQRKGRPRKPGIKQSAPAPTPREAQLLKRIWKLERVIETLSGKIGVEGEFNDVVRLLVKIGLERSY